MAIRIKTTWESRDEIEPPDGVSEDEFLAALETNDQEAWAHALDQTSARTAELTDWGLT